MTERLFEQDAYLRNAEATVVAGGEQGVLLDRTIFYPLGGGQPGDTGRLRSADGRQWTVVDTRKSRDTGEIWHVLEGDGEALPDTGSTLLLEIDWARRHRLMRMHTCLHLLSAVIVAPVTGGQVGDGYGRLDFDLEESPDVADVEARLNALVAANHPVSMRWISDAELEANPQLVKTMSVSPPRGVGDIRLVEVAGTDLQPCGGTHVANTGEIGPVRVAKIDKKGRQNRRVRLEFAETS
ncbi:MAG: alanyl-tRNA editing protein [Gammaproteobacteria bacterium]|nr:alanyl-tRNA editing protein [Gammaproteobacteria bacterium]